MIGLIRMRAKAGMTIPAAPRMTRASLKPEVLNSPCHAGFRAGAGCHRRLVMTSLLTLSGLSALTS